MKTPTMTDENPSRSSAWTLLTILIVALMAIPAAAQDQLFWGDTHLHSSNSTDAYLTGNMSTDPDTSYKFAKGLPVIHPGNRAPIRIWSRAPLKPPDFLAYTRCSGGFLFSAPHDQYLT
jgi:hypothetical protein